MSLDIPTVTTSVFRSGQLEPTAKSLSAAVSVDQRHQRVALFKPLTGIRAVAAAWVVFGHFSPQFGALVPAFNNVLPLTRAGYLGVDLFFVLSGFILAHNYFHEFRSVSVPQYGRFLWVRLARLYPVHLFAMFVLLAGLGAGRIAHMHFNMPERLGPVDFVRNLFLIHAWGFAGDTSWNGPAWSISAEWFAYLCFPILAVGIVRIRSAILAGALAIASYIVLLTVFKIHGTNWDALDNDLALVRVITQFTAGCLLYRVYTHGWRGSARLWEITAWLMAAGVVLYSYSSSPDSGPSLIVAPLLATLVLALARARGPMATFLSSRPMIFWGEVSYSLYMTHDLVRMILNKLLNVDKFVHSSGPVRAAVMLAYLVCIAGLAMATYFIIEKPARRWMRKLVGRGKPVDEAKLINGSSHASQVADGDSHATSVSTGQVAIESSR